MAHIPRFEELDYQKTPLGDLILRKRTVLSLENEEIYEIILGNAFLMSSMFTVVEQELSRFGLNATKENFPKENRSLSRKRGNLRNHPWKRLSHVLDVHGG